MIADWADLHGHSMEYIRFYEDPSLPDPADVELLIIMGGPMNVFDFHIHPWMQEEIDWVSEYIKSGKPLLGICLGAQIIAASLGADVYPGPHKEIGWHELNFLPALGDYRIWKDLPRSRKVFHWHGDTFPIPEGATRIAESQAFPNQGFIYGSTVIALQFHLEVKPASVSDLIENCRDELVPGPYIQEEAEMVKEVRYYAPNQELMFQLLDYLCSQV